MEIKKKCKHAGKQIVQDDAFDKNGIEVIHYIYEQHPTTRKNTRFISCNINPFSQSCCLSYFSLLSRATISFRNVIDSNLFLLD